MKSKHRESNTIGAQSSNYNLMDTKLKKCMCLLVNFHVQIVEGFKAVFITRKKCFIYHNIRAG